MKLLKSKSLKFKLLIMIILAISLSILPISFYSNYSKNIDKSFEFELNSVRILKEISELSHFAYQYNTDNSDNIQKTKIYIDRLVNLSNSIFSSENISPKDKALAKTIFEKESIEAFVLNPIDNNFIADSLSFSYYQQGVYIENDFAINVLVNSSSNVLPKMYKNIYKLSAMLKVDSADSSKFNTENINVSYLILQDYAQLLISNIRKATALYSTQKTSRVVNNLSNLTSSLSNLNFALSKISIESPNGADMLALLSVFENDLFRLCQSSDDLLIDLLKSALEEKNNDVNLQITKFSIVAFLILFFIFAIFRSILNSLSSTTNLSNLSAQFNFADAKDFFYNSPNNLDELYKIEKNIAIVVSDFSEIMDSIGEVLDVVGKDNKIVKNILSQQKSSVEKASTSILRADAKINLRDKSDSILSASTQSLRDRLNVSEQLARSQVKSVVGISNEMKSSLLSTSEVISNLDLLTNSAEQMSVIADTFTGVADQANILSLNLSIETARAGLKGSGLSTLAEQIRVLSQRIGVSVIDIESIRDFVLERLTSSKLHTNKLADLIESNSKILDEVNESLLELTSTMSKIASSTNAVSVSLRERGAFDASIQAAHENILKINEGVAYFESQYIELSSVLENTRKKLSNYDR